METNWGETLLLNGQSSPEKAEACWFSSKELGTASIRERIASGDKLGENVALKCSELTGESKGNCSG